MKPETEYWIVDKATLKELQKLKRFVDFVAGLEETCPDHKNNAQEVKYFIENIDKPETFKENWNTCIDIYDSVIQAGHYDDNWGLYWKKWWIWFELGTLEIRIEENYVDKNGYQDDKLIFYSHINFNKDFEGERLWGDKNYGKFVEDAFKFRDYITDKLNYVETEIDI